MPHRVKATGAGARPDGEASHTHRAPALHFTQAMNTRPLLNPFLAFAEGEAFLREQLSALDLEQLAAMVTRYQLPVLIDLSTASARALADDIVQALRDSRRPARAATRLGTQAG